MSTDTTGTRTAPSSAQASLEQLTEEQIASLPEPMQAQVRALLNQNKVLAAKVKEKDPSWLELAKYGKGVIGVKVSNNGSLQFTGTRKAYGGFYLFKKEVNNIFLTPEVRAAIIAGDIPADSVTAKLAGWMDIHDDKLSDEKKVTPKPEDKAKEPEKPEDKQEQPEDSSSKEDSEETPKES